MIDFSAKEQKYSPNNNGDISSSITQSWTQQALECYLLSPTLCNR